MAAPSPRSHRCRPAAAQPGCGTAPAQLRPLRSAPGTASGGEERWAGGGGLQHAPSILKSRDPPLPAGCRHTKGSVIHAHRSSTHKRLCPSPHARRTLHGDRRVALLRVLGALHLQLLGRERPISAAPGHGSRSWGPSPPFLHPDISSWPQPGRAGGHTWVLGEGVRVPAWLGAALAVPSSWDMVVMPLGWTG